MTMKFTRRTASQLLAGAALAVAISLGAPSALKAEDSDLIVFDWSGYEDENFFPGYKEKHGDVPTFAFFGDEEEAFTKLKSGFKADIAHPCSQSIRKWRDADLVKPSDTSRIAAWDDINAKLRDLPGFKQDGKNWIMPIDGGNSAVTERTDRRSGLLDVLALELPLSHYVLPGTPQTPQRLSCAGRMLTRAVSSTASSGPRPG